MRLAQGILLILACFAVMGLGYFTLQDRLQHEISPPLFSAAGKPFPKLPPIREIEVIAKDGTAVVHAIRDLQTIARLMRGLGEAGQDHFGDPDMAGRLYRVEMRSEGRTDVFKVNDLRGTGSSVSGKIYPSNPGADEVWSLPPLLLEMLTGSSA